MQPWIHWKWYIMHRYIYYLFIIKNKANKTPDARLDIHARGFWQRQRSAFFDVRVCHPNADSMYAERVMEIEQGTFTPLVFTATGGKADECVKYHSRLAELIGNKKGESYSNAISWIRANRHRTLCDTMLERLKIRKKTARLSWLKPTDR